MVKTRKRGRRTYYMIGWRGDRNVQLVAGTECATLEKARVLASDRKANGEAFEHEEVARVTLMGDP